MRALMPPFNAPTVFPSRRPTRSVYSTDRTTRLRRARLSRDYPEMTRDQITRDQPRLPEIKGESVYSKLKLEARSAEITRDQITGDQPRLPEI